MSTQLVWNRSVLKAVLVLTLRPYLTFTNARVVIN